MSCPHSMQPTANPSTCSLCIGATPTISRRLDSLPFDLCDEAFGEVLVAVEDKPERSMSIVPLKKRQRRAPRPVKPIEPKPDARVVEVTPDADIPSGYVIMAQAIERTGVNRRTIEDARNRGKVAAIRIGTHYFYRAEDLDTWRASTRRDRSAS